MRTHDNQAPSFQPQPGATTSHAATPHRPEGTFPSQAIAASPTNPFPRRPHEVWMEEPVASRKPVAQAETRTAPESRTTHTEWLQFRLTAPGQPEPDLPPWHSGLTMRAPQRSPSALDLPWREMQSTSTIGQPQDRSEQETDPAATPITTLSESAQPLQRQEEAGEAEDAGEEEKELQPKRLGEFSQPLVQRGVDVEAATFGEGEDTGEGDRVQRQFNLYTPGQAPPDLPQRHGIQARWALQRSPLAAEPYWYRGQPLQAKLTIGQPNDAYEQEADRVAEQVMSMALPATPNVQRQVEEDEPEAMQMKPLTDTITPLVQRQEMLEEQEPLQANCEDCEQEKPIQRSADGMPQVQPDLESRLNASQGGGSALPDEVRSFMEPRFGADFSQVRVHTGGEAVQMTRDLNAQAFTHKQDIYFGAGKAPAKDDLTAHELTHVVQQINKPKMLLQREPTGTSTQTSNSPGKSLKVPYKFKYVVATEQKIGSLMKLRELSFGGEISLEVFLGGGKQSPTQVKLGNGVDFTDPAKSSMVRAEVENQLGKTLNLGKNISAVKVKEKGNVELSPKGEIGIGIDCELFEEVIEDSVTFKLIEWDMEEKLIKKLPGFAVTTLQHKFSPAGLARLIDKAVFEEAVLQRIFQLGMGKDASIKYDMKAIAEMKFEPAWFEIGRRIGYRIAQSAATTAAVEEAAIAAVPISAAAIAAGVGGIVVPVATAAAIFAGLYFSKQGGEDTSAIASDSANQLRDFCKSFNEVMQGRNSLSSPGGASGAVEAQKRLSELRAKYPDEKILREELNKHDFFTEALIVAKPQYINQAKLQYAAKHSWHAWYLKFFSDSDSKMGVPPETARVIEAYANNVQ